MLLRSLSRRALSTAAKSQDAALLREWMTGARVDAVAAGAAFETLKLRSASDGVLHVALNRPRAVNAMNMALWTELAAAFDLVERDPSVRCVVLSGDGRAFSSGMDLNVFAEMQKQAATEPCEGRKREQLSRVISHFQRVISAPERCRVPVLAAVHGACIGAAVDLITACDLRFCDASAVFSVKEVDLAIVADVGTLQRLPKLVGEQAAKELAFTGRDFGSAEAERLGLVLKTLPDHEQLMAHVEALAKQIASKSPLTVRGVKRTINFVRDHSTDDSLAQVRDLNAATLYSDDLIAAIGALMSKSTPKFRDE